VPGTAVDPAADAVPVLRRRREAARGRLAGTPGRLRIGGLAAVLAALVFGLLGGSAFLQWGGALESARSDAAQLVRIQTVQNDLVKADAAAATAYLSGGSDTDSIDVYNQAIADASARLAQSAAVAGDAKELETVVEGLTRYTGLVAQARANNLQGLQVGAAYQRQAGEVLRQQIVSALVRVSRADQERIAGAYDDANLATVRLIAAGVIALLGLVLVQVWLARRTHRVLNLPLVAATLAVLIGLIAGFVTLSSAAGRADDVGSGPYTATVALASARTAAFDAKAQESLGLIARGNAGSYEDTAQAQITNARTELDQATRRGVPSSVSQAFTTWVTEHAKVRQLDNAGSWDEARKLAAGTSSTTFVAFDEASAAALSDRAAAVDSGLQAPRTTLIILGWLVLVLGLFAAGSGYTGLAQRLEEYR
jgi:hypothetical protein